MTAAAGHCLFDTAFGRAGIAWGDAGVTAVQFPEADDEATAARMLANTRGETPRREAPVAVREAIAKFQRHLETGREDLSGIALDMRALPPFYRAVYERSRAVGPGRTVTYGELAKAAGSPGSTRAVGTAMARNPFVVVVPCHRVMGANGAAGGFSAHGGLRTKARLLAREGAPMPDALLSHVVRAGTPEFPVDRVLAHLRARDPALRRVIDRAGPFTLSLAQADSTYAALARAVVYQQLTGKAAATIFGRVAALGGSERFPEPRKLATISDGDLRGAGLSASKVAALRDLAAKTLDGTVPSLDALEPMDDETIVERLTAVRGIGRWSAEMLLMFTLGRADVLPVGDYGVRNGLKIALGAKELPEPDALAKRGEKWRPWRSVASWYLWRAVDLERGTLLPVA